MKRTMCLLAILFQLSLVGQTNLLDTVKVSASLNKQDLLNANRHVVVISKEEISNMPAMGISEILDFAVGIDARQRGPFDVQTDLSIRGSSFEQVLVLINGVRMSDPQTGHHLMNLPISQEDIERIEVLLGGSSAVFGSGAFAGSINIITKKAKSNRTLIDGSLGSFDAYQLRLSQQLRSEKTQTYVGLSTAAHNGFTANTDAENHNVSLQHLRQLGSQELQFNAGYNQKAFGAQNFYSTNFPTQFEKTKTLFLNLGVNTDMARSNLKREIYWRRHWDEFQLFREDPDFYNYENGRFINGQDTTPTWYAGHNYHRTDVIGGKLSGAFQTKFGKTSLMAEYRFERIVSNNLGEPLEANYPIAGSRGSYTLGASRDNIDLVLEHEVQFNKLSINAALLYNWNVVYTDQKFYPSFNIGYALSNQQRLFASANRSFRLPSYTDLYYRLGGAQGSLDLLPERSVNLELGYKYHRNTHFAQVSVFRRMGRDLIDWVTYADSLGLFAANITSLNVNGLDANYRFSPGKILKQIEFGYSYYFGNEADEPGFESLYVLDYLRHKATARAQFSLVGDKLSISPAFSLQKRNGDYTQADGNLTEYPTILLVNLRVTYQLHTSTQVYVYGTNLLNQEYVDRGNVKLPGAWIWAGARVTL
jgi:vitamin B12 transporter